MQGFEQPRYSQSLQGKPSNPGFVPYKRVRHSYSDNEKSSKLEAKNFTFDDLEESQIHATLDDSTRNLATPVKLYDNGEDSEVVVKPTAPRTCKVKFIKAH